VDLNILNPKPSPNLHIQNWNLIKVNFFEDFLPQVTATVEFHQGKKKKKKCYD
jgi:hypothetical protein